MQLAGPSSLTRDETWAPALAAWSLPWTSREVLWCFFLYSAFSSLIFCPMSSSYLGVSGPSSWDPQPRDFTHSARAPRLYHSLQIISRQEAGMGLPWWLSSKESACNAGDAGSVPRSGWSPEEGNATHSSILAWRIPWTEALAATLHPMGSQRVRHDWATEQQQRNCQQWRGHPSCLLSLCPPLSCCWRSWKASFYMLVLLLLLLFPMKACVWSLLLHLSWRWKSISI